MFCKRSEDAETSFVVTDFCVKAPVDKGQVVGTIEVYKDGILYKTVNVVAAESVRKATYLDRLKNVSDGWTI